MIAEERKSPFKAAFQMIDTPSSRVALAIPEFCGFPPTLGHWEVLGILTDAVALFPG